METRKSTKQNRQKPWRDAWPRAVSITLQVEARYDYERWTGYEEGELASYFEQSGLTQPLWLCRQGLPPIAEAWWDLYLGAIGKISG